MTLKDLSGTIPGIIHHKVIDECGYGNHITIEAALILANVSIFSSKPSMHYLNITIRYVIKVFRKDTVPGSGSGVGGSGMLMKEEEIVKLMEEKEMADLKLQDRIKVDSRTGSIGRARDAMRCLDHIRKIVARDSAKLGVLEQLLAGIHVGIGLKDSYVADMEENE
ncbi:hypothetical protein Tco_1291340 [Tanacetum coccineum]